MARTLTKTHRTRKTKPRSSKRKAPERKAKAPTEHKRFQGYGENFFTQRNIELMETMLATGSVKVTCEKMHITPARYYQLTGDILRKWKMGLNTHNYAMGVFRRASNQKNILAKHLTEIKRVTVVDMPQMDGGTKLGVVDQQSEAS